MKQDNKNSKNIVIYIIAIVLTLVIVLMSGYYFLSNCVSNTDKLIKEENESYNISTDKKDNKNNDQTAFLSTENLNQINIYQVEYFTIIKRNDMFLADNCEKDKNALEALYKEVESNINQNNGYYKKYLAIEEKFKECDGSTTLEMNEFASNYYKAVDNLLNEVYQAVKAKLPESDFDNLKMTQRNWLKDISAYDTVFEKQDFGTMGTIIKLGYQTDMRKFRTLLLMMYL